MKKILLIICLILSLFGCSNWEQIHINGNESIKTHAVWISYVDYSHILTGKSQEEFAEEIQKIMTNLETLGINRIYLHASMFTDAIYQSEYYPWSRHASGEFGKALSYDPFEMLVNEATLRNIDVEAWINPLRSYNEDEMSSLSDSYIIKSWYNDEELRTNNLMLVDGRYYLNPGSSDVVELVENIVKELCTKYNIKGVHIDDYFFPTGISEDSDMATYNKYIEENPEVTLAEYRVVSIDNLVNSMYTTIKSVNDNLIFSISPSADIERNLNEYYADVVKWIQNPGYCDVIIPQIYFAFENDLMPFEQVVESWNEIMNKRIDIVYGLAGYKVGKVDEWAGTGQNEWIENIGILASQFELVKEQKFYDGIALYSYYPMFYPESSIRQQMKVELSKLKDAMK